MQTPRINKPEYYYTQVYYRHIEGVDIFIECPMTESNLGNQNVTIRVSVHHLQDGMEIVLIKNKVTYTLKNNINEDSYYTFGIFIDNPIGTNCTLEFVLKTDWGDYEVINLLYVVSLRDPSIEYSQEIVYWVDNTTEAVEEEFEKREEEQMFKISPATFFFYIILCLVVGFAVSFVGMFMGRHGAKKTWIKSVSIRENGILRSLFILTIILALFVPASLFIEPLSIISEEMTRAKYLEYEFVSPISYQELFYLLLQCLIFSVMVLAWFIFYNYGWRTQQLKDPVVPVEVTDKVHDPDVDIDIKTEEVTIAKDRNGIERVVKIEDLTILEAWKRYIYGIERTCKRLIVENRPLRDDLQVRIDGLRAVLLDYRGKKKPDARLDTELSELNAELDAILERKKKKDKLSFTDKIRMKLLEQKIKETENKVEVWVLSHGHANKLRMMADMRAYPKLVEEERAMEVIAYDAMNYANQSNRERVAKTIDEASPDEYKSLEEEILRTKVKRNRQDWKDSASRVQTEMLAPSTAQISD
jgi:hypothetical protein